MGCSSEQLKWFKSSDDEWVAQTINRIWNCSTERECTAVLPVQSRIDKLKGILVSWMGFQDVAQKAYNMTWSKIATLWWKVDTRHMDATNAHNPVGGLKGFSGLSSTTLHLFNDFSFFLDRNNIDNSTIIVAFVGIWNRILWVVFGFCSCMDLGTR